MCNIYNSFFVYNVLSLQIMLNGCVKVDVRVTHMFDLQTHLEQNNASYTNALLNTGIYQCLLINECIFCQQPVQ